MSLKKVTRGKNSGFTLIELIVVLFILSVFVLIAIPRYQDVLMNSKSVHDLHNAKAIVEAISRAVASGDYRFTATTLEKYNSGSWATVTDIITEMEANYLSHLDSPETGEKYVVKIIEGKVVISVDDTQIYP
ncbi:type II secretion system protein [Fusibacter ferrireducens]|uniref:Prepilin-type N-terminal cleavage/methylation domain-containing protein n=1 Tax=Fusibacter ferrireducens TaxID=2785058 RepID=A0ABR9ZTP2_9FIRM|nr:prepilin-type N-terminal cleavage/methylation domain-containing protein [Fusibacter ferrireducens]MBF4693850.1 prepilin-type N-terminal cleavage/methylation domain-containing protein [Fusibacter ferrireducens]